MTTDFIRSKAKIYMVRKNPESSSGIKLRGRG